MHTAIAALLLIFSSSTIAAPPESLELQWQQKEQQLENLYAEYWRTDYQIAAGNSQLSSLEVQRRIREAETGPVFLNKLKSTKFSDPILQRRQELFLREAT